MLNKALTIVFIATIFSACSIIKNDDPEQDVRNFILEFQGSLAKTDDDVVQYFRVKQSREAVLSVIRILQNKEKDVRSDLKFASADIAVEESGVYKITIPVHLSLSGEADEGDDNTTSFVIWVTAEDKVFRITSFQGEEFYQAVAQFKNMNWWDIERRKAVEERLWVYEKARELEGKFDSVIWYTTYRRENFFYVVEGDWTDALMQPDNRHDRASRIKMGLADSNGDLVIPIAYELIGTIGFESTDVVEVKKDGKVGYFDVKKKQLIIPPDFDMIIPYDVNGSFALVKKDTVYGWVSDEFVYTEGFPSEQAKDMVKRYAFLSKNIRLAKGEYAFCEVPNEENIGEGIIIPPTYLVANGLFREIQSGISTTGLPLNAGTEYIETKGSWLTTISDGLSAVVTTIRERYLEGREEFYETNNLLFVNSKNDTVGFARISGGEIAIRSLEPGLLEATTPEDDWFGENDVSDEYNLVHYSYFRIDEKGSITELKTKRLFPQTMFAKLDSTYLSGKFTFYDSKAEVERSTTFLSLRTITCMRDEILSDYKYAFPKDYYPGQGDWKSFEPQYTDDYLNAMTEIDRHNVQFLDGVIRALKASEQPV